MSRQTARKKKTVQKGGGSANNGEAEGSGLPTLALAVPPAPSLAQKKLDPAAYKRPANTEENMDVQNEGILGAINDLNLEEDDDNILLGSDEDHSKTLLALRQVFKKTKANLIRARSHLDFIEGCQDARKIPKGLQIKTKCQALLKDYTTVEHDFKSTNRQTEEEYLALLQSHYTEVIKTLEKKLKEVEMNMRSVSALVSNKEVLEDHTEMLTKTIDNVEKLKTNLSERKKRKRETLNSGEETANRRRRPQSGKGKGPLYPKPNPRPKATSGRKARVTPLTTPMDSTYHPPPPPPPPQSTAQSQATGQLPNFGIQQLIQLGSLLSNVPYLQPQGYHGQQQPQLHPFSYLPYAPAGQPPPLQMAGAEALTRQPPPLPGRGPQGFH